MLSFEQTIMERSPGCYIPNLVETSLPVLEKKIFEVFLPNMGVATILVSDPDAANKLSFPLPVEAPQNLALIGQVFSEEKMFEIVDG